jgi:hypothetical protein
MKTKMIILGIFALVFAINMSFVYGAEEVNLISYYPSPVATYAELKIGQPGHFLKTNYVDDPNISGDECHLLSTTDAYSIRFSIGSENRNNLIISDTGVGFDGYIKRVGAECLGSNANTHINLGNDSSITGSSNNEGYITIGGGRQNNAIGQNATITGGYLNVNSGVSSTICGGQQNNIFNVAEHATILGGANNTVEQYRASVCGGYDNHARGIGAIVCGGEWNEANGRNSSVIGGHYNIAGGEFSLAAGKQASATHDYSFVWGDGFSVPKNSNGPNTFNVYARRGSYFEGKVNIKHVLRLVPINGPPMSPETGDIYFEESDGTLRIYIDRGSGGKWFFIDTNTPVTPVP